MEPLLAVMGKKIRQRDASKTMMAKGKPADDRDDDSDQLASEVKTNAGAKPADASDDDDEDEPMPKAGAEPTDDSDTDCKLSFQQLAGDDADEKSDPAYAETCKLNSTRRKKSRRRTKG